MKFFFIKDSINRAAGIAVTSAGFLLLLFSIFGLTLELEKPSGQGITIAVILIIISLAIIVPGIALYRRGKKLSEQEELLKKTVFYVNTYRRISLTELCSKTGLSPDETENLLRTALELGLIKGNFDRTTEEFYNTESSEAMGGILKCPGCGAPVEGSYHKGETVKCSTCGKTFQQQ